VGVPDVQAGQGELAVTSHSQKNRRRDRAEPTHPSRDALETRRRRGNWRLAPLTALGEESAGRSIDEAAASRPAQTIPPPAFAALGLDDAAEIRRCFPTPSPPRSPPSSPLLSADPANLRPGEFGKAVLSPKLREKQHGPSTCPGQYRQTRYSSANTVKVGIRREIEGVTRPIRGRAVGTGARNKF
jgi:hypothetical protein